MPVSDSKDHSATPSGSLFGHDFWGYGTVALAMLLAILGVPWLRPGVSPAPKPKLTTGSANTTPELQNTPASIEAQGHMTAGVQNLLGRFEMAREQNIPPSEVPVGMESYLRSTWGALRNPRDRTQPALDTHIEVVGGRDSESMRLAVESKAIVLGQSVFLFQSPASGQPGFLAGAVKLKEPKGSTLVQSKLVTLDE